MKIPKSVSQLSSWFDSAGIKSGHHILVHSSFRKLRMRFPELSIEDFIRSLIESVGPSGSVIMPTFTYSLKDSRAEMIKFSRTGSPSLTGSVTEVFRKMQGVVRTSSPTHSFAMFGEATANIPYSNSPASPLGKKSVLAWLAVQKNSYVLMAGADFTAFTFGHYLEIIAGVPYIHHFPFHYLGKKSVGVSTEKEQRLTQVPGCSKSFPHFESHLKNSGVLTQFDPVVVPSYYIPVGTILRAGVSYFKNSYPDVMCPSGECAVCDFRRSKLHHIKK